MALACHQSFWRRTRATRIRLYAKCPVNACVLLLDAFKFMKLANEYQQLLIVNTILLTDVKNIHKLFLSCIEIRVERISF